MAKMEAWVHFGPNEGGILIGPPQSKISPPRGSRGAGLDPLWRLRTARPTGHLIALNRPYLAASLGNGGHAYGDACAYDADGRLRDDDLEGLRAVVIDAGHLAHFG